MSESTPSSSSSADPAPAVTSTQDDSGWRRWSVLLPALTFAAGLALGAAVVGVSQLGSDDGAPLAVPSPTASPTPLATSSPGALRVTVPAPCVQAAEEAETAYGVLDRAVEAVRQLDARALADVVDVAQVERTEIEALVDECRAAAGEQIVQPEPLGEPTVEASAEPSPTS